MVDSAAISTLGTINANGGIVELLTSGRTVVGLILEGTWAGTLALEVTKDGTTWVNAQVFSDAGVAGSASQTANASLQIATAGWAAFRVRAAAWTSGSATAVLYGTMGSIGAGGGGGAVSVADGANVTFGAEADAAAASDTATATYMSLFKRLLQRITVLIGQLPAALTGSGNLKVALSESTASQTVSGTVSAAQSGTWTVQPGNTANTTAWKTDGSAVTQPVSGTVTANQGTANTAANAWPSKLTDGTNTAAVKAASTAAVATDPAAVVTLSPNTALPAGANALGSVTVTGTPAISGTVTANQGTQNGAGAASWNVQGAAAVGATTAGNPVPTGLTDASGNAQYWRQANAAGGSFASPYVGLGAVMSYLNDAANVALPWNSARQNTDNTAGASMPGVALMMANAASSPNFDKVRNNVDVALLASAARTTTQTSADIVTYNAHSIIVTLDMTAVGTGSVTLAINYKDPASGKYIALLTGAAVAGNSTNMYTINPNIPAVANVSAQKDLGRIIQIVVTANNANTATYSVGYTLVN